MPGLDGLPFYAKDDQEGEQKNRLLFEGIGDAKHYAAERTLVFEQGQQGHNQEKGIGHIAVAPPGAVDEDGGAEQGEGEGGDAFARAAGELPDQEEHRDAGGVVENNRDNLDSVEGVAESGNQTQKVHIGRGVVGYADAQGIPGSELLDFTHPYGQAAIPIARFYGEQLDSRHQGQGQYGDDEQYVDSFFFHVFTVSAPKIQKN